MSTTVYWIIATLCAGVFATVVEAIARAQGTRGLVGSAILGLLGFELLGYIDWRRDMEAPLVGYVLLAGVPTIASALMIFFAVRRPGMPRGIRIALATVTWLVVAAIVFSAWPRL